MKQVWKVMAACLAAAGVIAIAGCGGDKASPSASSGNTASAVQAIKDKGVLVVGTSVDFPPYEFVDTARKGQIIGVDVALAQKVADKLGVRLVVQNVDFSLLAAEITKGNIDMAIAGLNPSKDRQTQLFFSKPYMNSPQTLLVRAGEAASYKTMADFKDKIIGAQRGSLQESLAKTRVPDAEVKVYNQIDDLLDALKEGKVDAVVYETVGATPYLMMDPGLADSKVHFENVNSTSAVAVGKKHEKLLNVVNDVIDENQKNIPLWIDEYSKIAVENVKNKGNH